MVSLRTTADRVHGGAAPYLVDLRESHALVVELVDALGGARDTAHVQHCVYLAQEFRLLHGRRYWFATDGATGLPYSHLLDDHMKTLLDRGVLWREPALLPGHTAALRVRAFLPDLGVPVTVERERVARLGDLAPDDTAVLAAAVFALSRRGHHPTHRRFEREVHAELRARLAAGGSPDDTRTEAIAAVCRYLGSQLPVVAARAYAR